MQKALGQLSWLWLACVCVVMLHTNFPPAPSSPPPHLIIGVVSIVLLLELRGASANANRLAARSFGARQRGNNIQPRCIYFPVSQSAR